MKRIYLVAAILAVFVLSALTACKSSDSGQVYTVIHVQVDNRMIPCVLADTGISCDWSGK